MMLHRLLLVMLHLIHITIIIFCVIGWLFEPARPWHLILCGLILASWFGVGAWKGWGYCLVTDIQWWLLRRLGQPVPRYGYMTVLWQWISGHEVNAQRVDQVTQVVFYLASLASLWVNWSWLRALL